ncbi:MAG: hypothetical protein AAF798_02115 [Bacteroidota bacterium]
MDTPDSKAPLERITMKSILGILLEQFHLERGIGYTVKQFILAPRAAIEEYLYRDRSRMIKPFRFALLMAAIATFLSFQFLPISDEMTEEFRNSDGYAQLPAYIQSFAIGLIVAFNKYFNLFFLSAIPLLTIGTYWVFRQFNFAEHLVINSYIFSIKTIVYCLLIPFIVKFPIASVIQSALYLGYNLYAFLSIFKLPLGKGILKSLLVWGIYQVATAIVILIALLFSLLF